MRRSIWIIFLLLFTTWMSAFGQQENQRGKIKIIITDIKNTEGNVFISLYNSSDGFPSDPDKTLFDRKEKISGNVVECEFKNIPYGTYAIAIMHDEDGDDEMDTNFIGIPKEGIGVSNDAIRTFGPPKFEDSKFELKEKEKTVTIKMHYF